MIAGMPSRVSSTRKRWTSLAQRGDLAGAQVRRAGQAGDLADAVADERARRGPRSSVPMPTISNDQTDPSWATFSSIVIRASRSATRCVERQGGVAIGSLDGRHQPFTDPAVSPRTICRSATA